MLLNAAETVNLQVSGALTSVNDPEDVGFECTFYALSCNKCGAALGRMYKSTTPAMVSLQDSVTHSRSLSSRSFFDSDAVLRQSAYTGHFERPSNAGARLFDDLLCRIWTPSAVS